MGSRSLGIRVGGEGGQHFMGKTKKSVHMKVPAPVINWGGGGVLLDSTF